MTNLTLTTMPEIARHNSRRGELLWTRHPATSVGQYGSEGGLCYFAKLNDGAYSTTGMFRGETTVCLFKSTTNHGRPCKGWSMTVHHPTYTNGRWLPVYFGYNEHEETHYVKAFQAGRVPLMGWDSTLKELKYQASVLASYTAVFPVRMSCEVLG